MNYKLMLRTLGRTLQLEALCLLPPLVTALLYREDPRPFVYTIVLGALLVGQIVSALFGFWQSEANKQAMEGLPPTFTPIWGILDSSAHV